MSKYLVTGGAGFIGSHLAHALIAQGHQVVVADSLVTGRRENVPAAAEFRELDLSHIEAARKAVDGCDYVLHQAAIPSVPRSVRDPLTSHLANVDATLNVLIAARDAGCKRLVYAGSSSAYGDTPTLPKHEGMPGNPRSPYALQKYTGEQYCQMFTRLYGFETVTTRYFNVFGPRQLATSPYSGVISLFIKAALANTSPTIHGDGRQTRDFTYIDNVVDGVLRAVTAPAAGEVINVASGGRISLLEMWEALRRQTGATAEPTFGPAREGDVQDSQADITKAARLLGYQPVVEFSEGLRRTLEWTR
ncbi:MAG: SDR family oxidoreductase [Acidimicrobiia bacterium]|nr:SDR family oxidoreductase [Acidimicrobiia bacterium]